jgi:hypothetical protein
MFRNIVYIEFIQQKMISEDIKSMFSSRNTLNIIFIYQYFMIDNYIFQERFLQHK